MHIPTQLLPISLLPLMAKSCLYLWSPKLSQASVSPTDNALMLVATLVMLSPSLGPDLFNLAVDTKPLTMSSFLRHCLH